MIPMSSNNASVATTVPAFIAKLWHMVSDPNCDDLICWAEDGTSFVIKDQVRFCSQLLPKYYKHNNMASFIRQLNKYGFHKVSSIESFSLRNKKGDYEFAHEFFVKDCAKSLEMIKRKMTTTSREIVDVTGDMTPLLQQLLLQVQELKDKNDNVEAKITTMKRENDALWREHSVLRQKYVKQQKMINQLIQFLVTLVQQTRGVNVNRSRGVPIILKDFLQTPLKAIEARKRDSPVISEIDPLETIDPKASSSTEYTIRGKDPLISSPNYLINSPIAVDQSDRSAMVFTAPDSPGEPTTLETSASPTYFTEPSATWCDGPTISGIQSLNRTFNIDAPSSSEVNLTACPRDATSRVTGPSQKNATGKERNSTSLKQPLKMNIPIVVKQEKLDPPLSSTDPMLNIDESTSTEPELIVDQPDCSAMLFTASDSSSEPTTLDISASPSYFTEPSVIWCDGPTLSGIQSLNSSFNIDSPSSSDVNLTACPQDSSAAIITSRVTRPSQKNATAVKKPLKMSIPIVVKQEKLDSPVSSNDTMHNIDEATTTEPELIDNQGRDNNRKEPEDSSSLVLSDMGSRQELENHLDLVQSDLDSLKDILQGLDTSAFMSLFNEQDPMGLNMPDGSNRQQLVPINPYLIDMSDMLTDEDGDPLAASPVDTTAIDAILNTPQPTPNHSVEPNFIPPKRFKK